MTNGSGIATVSFTGGAYVSTRAYNGTSLATAISNYDYLQFTILPTSGNNLVVNTISLYMGVSGGSMSASLLYSTDASFASYQTAGSVTGFSNTTVAQSSFTSLGINVNNGQTLYVRIYGWNLGSTYYFRTKAVVISGTTWSIPKITLTMGTNFISGLNTYNNTDNPILNDSVHILSGELTEQHQTSTLRLSNEKAHPNSDKARIFPNPVTNGILNVELENGISEQFNLAIFDMSGKTLIKRDYSHLNSLSLDLSAYPTGIYALQIQSSNFIFSDKFILK